MDARIDAILYDLAPGKVTPVALAQLITNGLPKTSNQEKLENMAFSDLLRGFAEPEDGWVRLTSSIVCMPL